MCSVTTHLVNDYTNELFAGLDFEAPSSSTTRERFDRLDQNGIIETRYDDDADIRQYYHMMEDSYDEIFKQLEDELEKEDMEAKVKEESVEVLIEEMEADAKNFDHIKVLLRRRNRQKEAREARKAEKDRLKELKKQLVIANKELTMFCCFVCSKVFTDEETMREHVSDNHLASVKEYKHKCPTCFRRLHTKNHLNRHMKIHTKEAVSCSICSRVYKEPSSLKIHMSSIHGVSVEGKVLEKKFSCEKCGAMFGIHEEVMRHRYYCGRKEEIAERKRRTRKLIEEMSAVTPDDASSVSLTDSASSVSLGSTSGRPVKDKSCPFCHLVFASMQSRKRHIQRKHSERVGEAEVDLHSYVKVKSPALPYGCDLCSKVFASHASLSTHLKRIHENKNDFECATCSKRYPLQSELRKHIRRVHESNALSE